MTPSRFPFPPVIKTEPTDSLPSPRPIPASPVSQISSYTSCAAENTAIPIPPVATCPVERKRPNPPASVDGDLFDSAAAKRSRIPSNLSNAAEDGGRRIPSHSLADDNISLPVDFLEPLHESRVIRGPAHAYAAKMEQMASGSRPGLGKRQSDRVIRQFWKAGDYESSDKVGRKPTSGMDHVRVHPKFLHSNATSHKWALGAIAELLDNAIDEAVHGATFVKVDTPKNPKKDEPMLHIEDDGGGMCPDNLRHCMSLGYSLKSKTANTIGQYGNGFKTSTMRLGADVIVFTRSQGQQGSCPTQSIGLLSYTFLRETGQEDIIVPMVDYQILPFGLRKHVRRNIEDWNKNMETITRWSPYSTESELLKQFADMKSQGTKVIVFNLWEDDEGQLELDLDANPYDIQVRAKRDEKRISMAEKYPNSWHYLTYEHSLRTYASILYLRLPPGFKMFLRGKEIEHHNIIDDLMHTQLSTYRPQVAANMHKEIGEARAVVTIGFVKDAKEHIDVQGFNVYHKNRLIKPFWRLWNSAGSRGRGIIGVLEANFVEPAHDKQGFERTIVLSRLESRLIEMQKAYWIKNCHKVGYVNHSLKDNNYRGPAVSNVGKVQPTTFPSVSPSSRVQRSALPEMNSPSSSALESTPSISKRLGLSTSFQVPVLNLPDRHQCKQMSPNPDASVSAILPVVNKTPQELHGQTHVTGTGKSSHQSSLRDSVNESSSLCQMFSPSSAMQKQAHGTPLSLAPCSLQTHRTSMHQETLHQSKKVPSSVPKEIEGACPVSHDIRTQDRDIDSAHCATEGSGNVVEKSGMLKQDQRPSHSLSPYSLQPRRPSGNVVEKSGMLKQDQRPFHSLSPYSLQPRRPSMCQTALHPTEQVPVGVHKEIQGSCPVPQDIRIQDCNSDSVHCATECSGNVVQKFCTEEKGVPQGDSSKHVLQDNLSGAVQVHCMLGPPPGQIKNINTSSTVQSGGQVSSEIDRVYRCSAPNRQDAFRSTTTATVGSIEPSMQKTSNFEGLSAESPHSRQQKDQTVGMPLDDAVQDHSHVKASTNNNNVMHNGKRLLEDLGRLVAKKAVSNITNKVIATSGPVDNSPKPSQELRVQSQGKDEELGKEELTVVADSSTSNNKTSEAQIRDMELEIQSLQGKLKEATEQRDELKQLLLEERISGHRKREALQKTLGETLAAMRELEAQNNSLRLAHSIPFRIAECLKNSVNL